ncbi:N-acetyl-gamma-glutamyl-phosphate reductase [Roseimaritima ulvae]|uniref:N-acetyl-gamma-glutamyl-phosphate reductase n=1 Tax=Roseimaritima ulvae TaxID=980254 RepID=A0A5B9QM86_9BACT|nr:N-acetyl-gamma-glutamyl-phosphate reductase [Roseimaritima ulvae]QEG40108.1 N-acetyl-gamma-glutamyl-phosphate reductase [Roseimaritima ulvae]
MIRVGVVGATGYTAFEAIRLINRHPQATVTAVTSRKDVGTPISDVHRALTGQLDLSLSLADPQQLGADCDVVLCCLPHAASAETVRALSEQDLRVIDLSADFRLRSAAVYERWYATEHPWPERLGEVAYGLPELFAEEIADARLVANPGCYPTSAILPLAPLLKAGVIETDIIVDSKSGVSGAGRTPKLANLYCEANESIAAYSVGKHRHQPEVVDVLDRFAGVQTDVLFTPHLTPMDRGILSTIYVQGRELDAQRVKQLWQEAYAEAPFLHVVDSPPATKHVSGTNHVHMTAIDAGKRVVLLSVLDNVVKGASGAAVQNMNCMFGLDQTLGLGA